MKCGNEQLRRLFITLVLISLVFGYLNKRLVYSEFARHYQGDGFHKSPAAAPTIFCLILTTEVQLDHKAKLVYDSWARLCDNHTFVTTLPYHDHVTNNSGLLHF
jgi:hypothetical protein